MLMNIRSTIFVLIVVFIIHSFDCVAFSVKPKFASITAGGGYTLKLSTDSPNDDVTFISSSQLSVDAEGNVSSLKAFDPKDCNAWVVAVNTSNKKTDTCKISIVPWVANLSSITVDKSLGPYKMIGKSGDSIRVIYNNVLYKMENDFSDMIPLSPFKLLNGVSRYYYIKTPHGSFIRDDCNIYYSKDDNNWELEYITKGPSLNSNFGYKYNPTDNSTSLFTYDYICDPMDSIRCGVYRKIIGSSYTNTAWERIIEFPSKYESLNDKSILNACRHVHTLNIDPYTDHVWIGTGDFNQHSHIYYSPDNGNSWKQVGFGSQDWRVLAIWFTKDYIYWSTDTNSPQAIFRIPRTVYDTNNEWPDMTQIIDSGLTKVGVNYYIIKSNNKNLPVGSFWKANSQISLTSDLVLYAINDPKLDYREKVADLPNNPLWDHKWVIDTQGDSIILLTSSAESKSIDSRSRIFGIKERSNKTVDVQELISEEGKQVYSRFFLYQQGENKKIYMTPYDLVGYKFELLQTSLNWKDNSISKGGNVTIENEDEKSGLLNLRLVNYDGKILTWQFANKSFNWKNIINGDAKNDTTEKISVTKEKNSIKYIRALVQKGNDIPVPSTYITIDSIQSPNKESEVYSLNEHPYSCYPTVFKSDFFISFNNDSIGDHKIELFSLDGKLVYREYLSSYYDKKHHISVSNLLDGVYVLKISNNIMVFAQKIIKNNQSSN